MQLRERVKQLESALFLPQATVPSTITPVSSESFDTPWGDRSGSGTLALGPDGSMAFYGRSASPDVRNHAIRLAISNERDPW